LNGKGKRCRKGIEVRWKVDGKKNTKGKKERKELRKGRTNGQ
jgi:hypothetical protein